MTPEHYVGLRRTRRYVWPLLVLTTACGTHPQPIPPAPAPPAGPTFVSAVFELTWYTVLDHFAAINIPLATIDHDSGVVESERVPVSAADAARLADCGSADAEEGSAYLATSVTYRVVVQDDGSSSEVLATASWTPRAAEAPFPCVTKGVWEAETQEAIRLSAEANR